MKETKEIDLSASSDNVAKLLQWQRSPGVLLRTLLYLFSLILGPLTIAGSLYGYARGYNKFLEQEDYPPDFEYVPPIIKASMIIFGIIGFLGGGLLVYSLINFVLKFTSYDGPAILSIIVVYIVFQLFLTALVFKAFRQWQIGINNLRVQRNKFGTARFARSGELAKYENQSGIYVGGEYVFNDKGHVLTVAGTRGGKGTSLIIPNLLGYGNYAGSWVIIDPKGENAAITARYQKESGRKVVILNPWNLLPDNIPHSQSYNPLDILSDKSNPNLVDDAQIIAEMIVPIEKSDRDRFFTDNARTIVTGLLLHLVTSQEKQDQTFATLWKWVRLAKDDWHNLLAEMAVSDDPVNGEIIQNAANEIAKLETAGDKTYGSIIATVLQCTDFIKSPALQASMRNGFDPYELADGNTCLYVIIPADKLQSHARWLRLIVTTTMRAVIRKPNKRVTFVLDEFAALGYLPEIETALSTYAGFEITVWPILQSLIQLKGLYHDSWETFTANCTVRQYFSINDNFTADYVSHAIGKTSHVTYNQGLFSISNVQANERFLVTPDELRRGSGQNIFSIFGDLPPTFHRKMPYYEINHLKMKHDKNPYFIYKS